MTHSPWTQDSKLTEAVDELEEILLKIRKRVIEWANLNRIKSLMRQGQIASDIGTFHQTLDTHVIKFQIISSIDLNRQHRRLDLCRQNDQEEVKEMLRALVRNVEDLQAAVEMRDDVPALMQTIQEELRDQQPGTEERTVLRASLNTLHNRTGILPPLTNLTGQVIKLSEYPAVEGGMADIYEGQWLGDEKVMLKTIKGIESASAVRRFWREVDIWRQLQHIHILRFYGVCDIGRRHFAVSPWADGGNLLVYLRNHSDCDRMRFLSEVALGLMYLHTFKPTIVHGDLRAANVLVSVYGEALLADFGLSKIIAEEEGAEVASTSLSNAGSSRWMAPELFEGDPNLCTISTASDVWSFGMLSLEVLTGHSPYQQCRLDGQVIAKLISHVLPERPERTKEMYERGLSDNMWLFIQRCWSWDPASRPQVRTLAGDMRKLHVEHMRECEVAGDIKNASGVFHPTMFPGDLFKSPFWAMPPSSSNRSISPPSLPLQMSPGVHESLTSYTPENDISTLDQTLDTHVTKFQMISSAGHNYQQRRLDLSRQRDQAEVKEMLRALVRNVKDLQAAVGTRDDVSALMQTIQEELQDQEPGTEEHTVLRASLNILHNRTGILPPLTNLTGQVVKLSEYPAAEGGMADIYEGQWVGDEKVMLKAIRRVESESAIRRFQREMDIWRQLQHIHILRFYGVCDIGGRQFAVAPWADGGNLLVYLRKHPGCDRIRFLSEVALGLMYLHIFKPTIVHGDLRAMNVLVSASGGALLADFGLSKIIEEEEGVDVASTSLSNAGSSRWMAPELFQGDASLCTISTASDVWSFGMLSLEVLTGHSPYRQCRIDGQAIAKLISRILPERPERTEEMYERGLSDSMWLLMQRCWSWDPASRPQMRTLAGDVRKLHVEHMRQYGVAEDKGPGSSPEVSYFHTETEPPEGSQYSVDMPGSPSLRMISLYSPSLYSYSSSRFPR